MSDRPNLISLNGHLITDTEAREMIQNNNQAIEQLSQEVAVIIEEIAPITSNYGEYGQFAVSDGKGGIIWKTLVEAEEVSY